MKFTAVGFYAVCGLLWCSEQAMPASAAGSANSASGISSAAAIADFSRIEHEIRGSSSLALDGTMIAQGDSTSEIEASGRLQRPDLYRLTISRAGAPLLEMADDGVKCVAYSPKTGKYYRCNARPSDQTYVQFVASSLGDASEEGLFDSLAIYFNSALEPPLSIAPGETAKKTTSEAAATLHGQPVMVLNRRSSVTVGPGLTGSVDTQIIYSTATTDLKSYVVTVSQPYQPLQEMIHLTFARCDGGAAPSDQSTFAYAPPSTATLESPDDIASSASAGDALSPGAAAPDFTVQTPAGASVKLSDYAGKVVVIDCWATWCGPCQASLPITDKIAHTYTAQGVVFMPVCVSDTKDNFNRWLPQHKNLTMHFLYDPAGQSAPGFSTTLYHADGIPTQFVVGKDGKIAATFVGYDPDNDPDESSLAKAIAKALATD